LRIELLTTGDELTIGEIVDGNAAWLGAALFGRGQRVAQITTVGDDLDAIVSCLREAAARCDFLVVTGGLGPTLDDLTVDAVCAAFDLEATLLPDQLTRIRRRFEELGRTFTPNNERQARVPAGSEVLGNDNGTATAFVTTAGGCRIHCLPGVPAELRPLAERHLFREIEARLAEEGVHRCTRIIRCVGIPESHLDEEVRKVLAADAGDGQGQVRYGIRTSFPENHVRFTAEGRSQDEAERRCAHLEAVLRQALGPVAYGGQGDTLASVTLAALRTRGWRVALAESLTAGYATSLLAGIPGASEVLVGAMVSYSMESKVRWLGIPREVLEAEGPVSAATAAQMAEGALRSSGADVAVSLTGWAGPEAANERLGEVYAACATVHMGTQVVRRRFPFGRNAVRKAAAYLALDLLRRRALDLPLD
jgi:nicotinamide-nucleotide amidase